MTLQPTTRAERYEKLLVERTAASRRLTDAICHREVPRDLLMQTWRTMAALDQQLDGFRRFNDDYLRLVMPAEDARWHLPPELPADHASDPCAWCLRAVVSLGADLVLVPPARRAAR